MGTLSAGDESLRETDVLSALQVWMSAGFGQSEWSTPLTWSLAPTGAKAMALFRKKAGSIDLVGASAGASTDFLYLCKELGAATPMRGLQERHVVGLGRLAWSVSGNRITLITFALYERRADLSRLGEIGSMAERCFSASLVHRAS